MFRIQNMISQNFLCKEEKNKKHPNVKYREVVGWLKEYIADSELKLDCYHGNSGFKYSSVPNRRAVRNKRAGGKILKKH